MRNLAIIVIALVSLVGLIADSQGQQVDFDKIQNAEPGTAGYIQWNKSKFAIGDTVWVFNANAQAQRDKNDYILPSEFYFGDHSPVFYLGVIVEIDYTYNHPKVTTSILLPEERKGDVSSLFLLPPPSSITQQNVIFLHI
jgi:hypothetical protein